MLTWISPFHSRTKAPVIVTLDPCATFSLWLPHSETFIEPVSSFTITVVSVFGPYLVCICLGSETSSTVPVMVTSLSPDFISLMFILFTSVKSVAYLFKLLYKKGYETQAG